MLLIKLKWKCLLTVNQYQKNTLTFKNTIMSFKKITFAIASIAILSISLTSCSNDNVADQDSLYNIQAVDKTKMEMPSNG